MQAKNSYKRAKTHSFEVNVRMCQPISDAHRGSRIRIGGLKNFDDNLKRMQQLYTENIGLFLLYKTCDKIIVGSICILIKQPCTLQILQKWSDNIIAFQHHLK